MFNIKIEKINTIDKLNDYEVIHKNADSEKLPWSIGQDYKTIYPQKFVPSTFITVKKPNNLVLKKDIWINTVFNYLKTVLTMKYLLSVSLTPDFNVIALISSQNIRKNDFIEINNYLKEELSGEIYEQGIVEDLIESDNCIDCDDDYDINEESNDKILNNSTIADNKEVIDITDINKYKEINEEDEDEEEYEEINEDKNNVTVSDENIPIENEIESTEADKKVMQEEKENLSKEDTKERDENKSQDEAITDNINESSLNKTNQELINMIIANPELINQMPNANELLLELLKNVSRPPIVPRENISNNINESKEPTEPTEPIESTEQTEPIDLTKEEDKKDKENKSNTEEKTEVAEIEPEPEPEAESESESESEVLVSELEKEEKETIDMSELSEESKESQITNETDIDIEIEEKNNSKDNAETEETEEKVEEKTEEERKDSNIIDLEIKDNKKFKEIKELIKETIGESEITDTKKWENKDIPFLNALTLSKKKYVSPNPRKEADNEIQYYVAKQIHKYISVSVPQQEFKNIFANVMRYFTKIEKLKFAKLQRKEIPVSDFEEDVTIYINNNYKNLNEKDKELLLKKVLNASVGLYILEDLINDPKISDIRIIKYNDIRVKVYGENYSVNASFIDDNDFETFINGIVIRNGITLDYGLATFSDTTSSKEAILRFDITTKKINSSGSSFLHIRKVDKVKKDIESLIEAKMMPRYVADYLIDKVKNSKGIFFSGQSASGKSTLFNGLIDYIPKNETITVLQENEELFSNIHPDIVCQHIGWVIPPKGNPVYYGLEELIRNALLTNTSYILVGELKGRETRDFISACATSHKCMATIHASSAEDTPIRAADLIKYGSDYTIAESLRMIKDMDVIVYLKNYKVEKIIEISKYDDKKEKLIYKTIYIRDWEKNFYQEPQISKED